MNEAGIRDLIRADQERMRILEAAASLKLTDWWIGAGFLRNAVWDHLFGAGKRTPLNDIDLVYWKPLGSYGMSEAALVEDIESNIPNPVWEEEERFATKLAGLVPEYEFELKNQARMHLWSKRDAARIPYASAAEGIADWVETATCVGVRFDGEDNLEIMAAYGIDDLVHGIIRPAKPALTARAHERAEAKGWLEKWPQLRFEDAV